MKRVVLLLLVVLLVVGVVLGCGSPSSHEYIASTPEGQIVSLSLTTYKIQPLD